MARAAKKPNSPDPLETGGLPVEVLPDGGLAITFPGTLLSAEHPVPVEPASGEAVVSPEPGAAPLEVPAPVAGTGSLLAQLNEARRVYAEQEARARATPGGAAPKEYAYTFQRPADHDYDKDPALNTALERALAHQGTTLGRELLRLSREERSTELGVLRAELAVHNAIRQTNLWNTLKPDYRKKVETSGVNALVEIDTITGRPKYPDKFDPVVRQIWLTHPDPGAFAYQLAEETLAEQARTAASVSAPASVTPEPGTNGHVMSEATRAAALRAAIDAETSRAVTAAATRPQGIAALPAGAATRQVVRSVAELSDATFATLLKERPEVIEYLKRSALAKIK